MARRKARRAAGNNIRIVTVKEAACLPPVHAVIGCARSEQSRKNEDRCFSAAVLRAQVKMRAKSSFNVSVTLNIVSKVGLCMLRSKGVTRDCEKPKRSASWFMEILWRRRSCAQQLDCLGNHRLPYVVFRHPFHTRMECNPTPAKVAWVWAAFSPTSTWLWSDGRWSFETREADGGHPSILSRQR